jgi:hypothetical protein
VNGWVKSSFCGHPGCVEVSHSAIMDTFHVRDSKDPEGPELEFTRAEWEAFIKGVKAGELDHPGCPS